MEVNECLMQSNQEYIVNTEKRTVKDSFSGSKLWYVLHLMIICRNVTTHVHLYFSIMIFYIAVLMHTKKM